MSWRVCGLSAIFCLFVSGSTWAQVNDDAQWVWADTGNPLEEAPAGKVWFRREVRGNEPSTGAIRIACDDHFVLWVNGKKIGEGGAKQAHRFNLNGIVERGPNVIAIEAENKDGKAGLFVDGEIRGQSGGYIKFDTPDEWQATLQAPTGDAWKQPKFDANGWAAVKPLGTHADSPWKEIAFAGTYLDRFELAPGFELKRIAEPEQVGSLVAITWGNRGRLFASPERKPLLCLADTNGDGTFDQVTEYCADVKNCQGLCQVLDDLYVIGDGPQGTGLYRLPDADHDDKADEVVHLVKHKGGMGEHGPHDILWGPDGWLYHNLGNHSHIENVPEPNSPCRNISEGYLLEPKYEDGGGHAVGIKAPGGTIWRFSRDGKQWWLETNGFRNEYDMAFNSQGDLFAFDSDMEWDVNLPWYRPVRINHCVPGAEFGWRSGAAKWPAYYIDSLPGTIDIGRGSPTGVVFYEHTQFPEKYRGTLLNCDWSMGRLIVASMKKDGATYTGTWENLVTGNPLNISDVEVDRDGTVIFSTGGRNTEGGLYRVTYTGSKPEPVAEPTTIAEVLAVPQGQSNWARDLIRGAKEKLGDQWEAGLLAAIRTGIPKEKLRALSLLTQFGPAPEIGVLTSAANDGDASVRAFAVWLLGSHNDPQVAKVLGERLKDPDAVVRRRACEAFVRSGLEAPVDGLLYLLSSRDRWERWAARIALERIPAEQWKDRVLASQQPDVLLTGLLALSRVPDGPNATELMASLKLFTPTPGITAQLAQRYLIDLARLTELFLLKDPTVDLADGAQGRAVAVRLLGMFVNNEAIELLGPQPLPLDHPFVMELARVTARLQIPEAVPLLVQAMRKAPGTSTIHYAICLSYFTEGWSPDDKDQVLDWYENTRDLEGGHSLQGYLRNIMTRLLEKYTPSEREVALLNWKVRPYAAQMVLTASRPDQIQNFEDVLNTLLTGADQNPEVASLIAPAIESLGKSDDPASQTTLRNLFDRYADRRDLIARGLATHPSEENVPFYLRAILTGDNATAQQCLQALRKAGIKPEAAEPFRAVIVAGLKLGDQGSGVALALLSDWTGLPAKRGGELAQRMSPFQEWYAEKFPDAVPAELSKDDLEKSKYSLQQLVEMLDGPTGEAGSVERGKAIFTKANCIKCHRFLKDGEGVGPDLTTVRRRFQKREILESVLYPSQVISDQYKSVTVVTTEGLVYNGMKLPQAEGSDAITLLLSDATKVTIPRDKVDEEAASKVSVMPEGLFKELSLEEIADLFAFLETSKSNPEPMPAQAGK